MKGREQELQEGYELLLSYIPDDGNVVTLLGPHVDISPEGEVGKFSRVGQKKLSHGLWSRDCSFQCWQRWGLFRSVSKKSTVRVKSKIFSSRKDWYIAMPL